MTVGEIAKVFFPFQQLRDGTQRIAEHTLDGAWRRNVLAVLETFEIAAHFGRPPGFVAGDLRNVIPVTVLRDDSDHGVMRRATSQGSGARIKDTVFAVEFYGLGVFGLLRVVTVMADEVIPRASLVFGREPVKNGHLIQKPAGFIF